MIQSRPSDSPSGPSEPILRLSEPTLRLSEATLIRADSQTHRTDPQTLQPTLRRSERSREQEEHGGENSPADPQAEREEQEQEEQEDNNYDYHLHQESVAKGEVAKEEGTHAREKACEQGAPCILIPMSFSLCASLPPAATSAFYLTLSADSASFELYQLIQFHSSFIS